jgi:hypothetical protein
MPEAKILGKGNKRRVAEVRWKRREVVHATILSLLLAIFSVGLVLWFDVHHLD